MRTLIKLVCLLVALGLWFCPGVAQAKAKYVMKISHNLSSDPRTSMNQAGALALKEFVEKQTNGQVEIQIYPAGQIGDQRVNMESVQMGTLEMAIIGDAPIVNWFKPFGVIGLPYAFSSTEIAWKVLDGPFGQELSDGLAKASGVRVLCYGDNGFRHLTNNKREIKVPSDMKGLKIRVQENPAHIQMLAAMGAIPTPMPFTEVYTSLQQGVLDGQENPINVILTSKLNEVQKYLTLDGHIYSMAGIFINEQYFQALPADIKEALVKGSAYFNEACREVTTRMANEGVDELANLGMQVYKPTPEDLAQFREAAQKPVVKYLEEQGLGDWVQKILNAIAEAEK